MKKIQDLLHELHLEIYQDIILDYYGKISFQEIKNSTFRICKYCKGENFQSFEYLLPSTWIVFFRKMQQMLIEQNCALEESPDFACRDSCFNVGGFIQYGKQKKHLFQMSLSQWDFFPYEYPPCFSFHLCNQTLEEFDFLLHLVIETISCYTPIEEPTEIEHRLGGEEDPEDYYIYREKLEGEAEHREENASKRSP